MGIGLLTLYLCALGSALAIKIAAVPVRRLSFRFYPLYLIDSCRLRLTLHRSVRVYDHMGPACSLDTVSAPQSLTICHRTPASEVFWLYGIGLVLEVS